MHKEGDFEGIGQMPPAQPHFWICPPHLALQTCRALVKFSPLFQVYYYGGRRKNDIKLPQGVTAISEPLHRGSYLFRGDVGRNACKIVVVSWSLLNVRNGVSGFERHLKKEPTVNIDTITAEERAELWRQWPKNLEGLIVDAVVDESQLVKTLNSTYNKTIRQLNVEWTVCLTATPLPWRYTDYAGQLALIQNRFANDRLTKEIATALEAGKEPPPNPFHEPVDRSDLAAIGRLCTYAALDHYVPESLSAFEQGTSLAKIWSHTMIRRDYYSKCKINPKGDEEAIGGNMPPVRVVRQRIEPDQFFKRVYKEASEPHRTTVIAKDGDAANATLNGRNVRLLNLFSLCPMLQYTPSVHHVRIDDLTQEPKTIQDRKGNKIVVQPTKANEELIAYMELCQAGKHAEFLHRLLTEMKRNATAAGKANRFPWP